MKFKLRPALSVIALSLSAVSLLIAAGCAAPVEPDGGDIATAAAFPTGPYSGKLHLSGDDSTRLHIGDPLSVAQEAFPKPKRSFSITSVPPEFDEKYQVYGWENPSRSFAVLTQRGMVALALDINEKVDDSFISARVKSATEAYGEPTIPPSEFGQIRYWFWEDGITRAMICVAVDSHERKTLSHAIGYTALMDYLRMSPVAAEVDGEKALKTLFEVKS